MRDPRRGRRTARCGATVSVFLLFCGVSLVSQATSPPQRIRGAGYRVSFAAPLPDPPQASSAAYLIDIYPLKPAKRKTGDKLQTIKLDAVGNHRSGDPPFIVHAEASSHLPVTLSIPKGPATVSGSVVTLLGPGQVELQATQPGNDVYKAALAEETFQVEANDDYCVPGLIPASSLANSSQPSAGAPSASAIISLLGSPSPFSFKPLGNDEILIYSDHFPLNREDKAKLAAVKASIAKLLAAPIFPEPSANSTPSASTPAYALEVRVPHAVALGDLATAVSTLDSSLFKVYDVGKSKILITSSIVPSCHDITQFLNDIRALAWQPHPVPAVAQVFHLQASDVANVLNAAQPGNNKKTDPAGSAQTPVTAAPQPGTAPSSTSVMQPVGTSPPANSGSPSSAPAPGASNPPQGTAQAGTTPAPPDQPNSGGGNAKPTPSASATAPPLTVSSINPDLLLFTGNTPGNDAAIAEKKRILALLDLPRPDVIINAWSMQESTSDRKVVGEFGKKLQETVSNYNAGLQRAILRGWAYLNGQVQNPKCYFDHDFYNYVTYLYVADPPARPDPGQEQPDQVASDVLNMRLGPRLPQKVRDSHGICSANKYCLGYKTIFRPLEPTLTHLLLALLAAKDPWGQAQKAINFAECADPATSCVASLLAGSSCQDLDNQSEIKHIPIGSKVAAPPLFLECFRQAAHEMLGKGAGLVWRARAAIADFLFNYKMALQYPHEFAPYELGLSAQKLNSVFNPFADAFNRDLAAYQELLRKYIQCQVDGRGEECQKLRKSWVRAGKETLVNNGIVTVRTLSTAPATVSTTTQSFLDATQQPTVQALLSSIESAHPGGAAATAGQAHMTDLLQNISPIQAQVLVGALNAMQSSKVQIGRSLYLSVTPRSLNGASSAEIDVTLKADEAANPTYYSSGPTSGANADVSRVAVHDVSTRVRVDSLKLFDISSFSAELQRSRPRFPLIPPFVELPYIGTLVGVPLRAAKEYHRSTAILSAIVVPTATDLAYGLTFVMDRVVDAAHADECHWPDATKSEREAHPYPCALRKAESLSDLDRGPIFEFHKKMIKCLATGSGSCSCLNFDSVFRDRQ
jgi:hypothetical protein